MVSRDHSLKKSAHIEQQQQGEDGQTSQHHDLTVPEDEAALIEAARERPAAFAELYRRYLPRIYRYVYSSLPDKEQAADVTQQIFLRVLVALPNYQQRGIPFAAWLFRIARHAVHDERLPSRHVTLSWEALPEEHHPAYEVDMVGRLIQQEHATQLHKLLADLDPFKRELLALRFAAGLSAPQIAAVVGKSPASVKKQLTRILHTLKEHYHE